MMINIFYCNFNDNYTLKSMHIKNGTTIDVFLTNILRLDYKTKVGVYGKLVSGSYIIQNNDRIELYERVIADPKISRKKRANYEKS